MHVKEACVPAYVSLGSNMGDTARSLARALEALGVLPGVKLAAVSRVYRTEPQDLRDQPYFANQAARLDCSPDLTAQELLRLLQDTEKRLGRTPSAERFGPRIIDLDLLLYGKERLVSEHLVLPHPRMLCRAFVLLPLAQIAPGLTLPGGLTVERALADIAYTVQGDTIFQS